MPAFGSCVNVPHGKCAIPGTPDTLEQAVSVHEQPVGVLLLGSKLEKLRGASFIRLDNSAIVVTHPKLVERLRVTVVDGLPQPLAASAFSLFDLFRALVHSVESVNQTDACCHHAIAVAMPSKRLVYLQAFSRVDPGVH
jgi:hypothetical protein